MDSPITSGLMAINNFPMAPVLLEDLTKRCDTVSLRFDLNNGDKRIWELCKNVVLKNNKKLITIETNEEWNRYNWREDLIRSLDNIQPKYVLFLDSDEKYDRYFNEDFELFKQSDAKVMMFGYTMIAEGFRNVMIYPMVPHCKVYKWEPGITYIPYRGCARSSLRGVFHPKKSKIEHYCFYTRAMEKSKILHV